ncbi:delta-like protein D [Littorina saxatilis]|uniref:delta-like protein D n=1 Tax=Littorina saxatilis TaxID=31220 RepID=UPI0038B63E8B
MAPSTLSLFLTALMFAGAQGATKDLDAECDPSADTCTNSVDGTVGLTCDTLANPDVCKIKVDQACSADKCVTGAACDTASSNQCKCGAGYTATDAKVCAAIAANTFGGACTGGPAQKGSCSDANALCSAATGHCACTTGYTGTDGAGCSGAISVIASALTVMLVASSGRLFSLH